MRRYWVGFFLFVSAAVGCAPAFQRRLPDVTVVPSRLVVMPVVTHATERDFNNEMTPKPEWAEAMGAHIAPEVLRLARRQGAFALQVKPVQACGAPCVSLLEGFMAWSTVASMEIAAQMKGRHDFHRHSVGDWRAKRDYTPLRQALGADFALVVVARNVWDTTGRAVIGVFAGIHTYFRQVGVACVANLVDGRMVWCHAAVDGDADLRTDDGAQALVRALFGDLWALPPEPPHMPAMDRSSFLHRAQPTSMARR